MDWMEFMKYYTELQLICLRNLGSGLQEGFGKRARNCVMTRRITIYVI
jgi:hypothetical protein